MSQNIYDDPQFFDNYATLPRSQYGLEGAPEWPYIVDLLPDLKDKSIVDLGCGYGWFCRYASEQGAQSCLGLDLSEKMIAKARSMTSAANITYDIADMDQLQLEKDRYDLVYSSLAFHYIADFKRLVTTIYDALHATGDFIFTIEHPIFMASLDPQWKGQEENKKYWPVDHYAQEGQRITNWMAEGVVKYHRRLSTTLNCLIEAGFTLQHIYEWAPTAEQIAQIPALAEETERPMIVIIKARKETL